MIGTNASNLNYLSTGELVQTPAAMVGIPGQCPLKFCCAKKIFFCIHVDIHLTQTRQKLTNFANARF